jgi:hypothetical protein
MEQVGEHGIVKDTFDLDVKTLLEKGQIVIEKQPLDTIIVAHKSPIRPKHDMHHAVELVNRAWSATNYWGRRILKRG